MFETVMAYGQIVIADLILSGDNALIIGMAAAGLAPRALDARGADGAPQGEPGVVAVVTAEPCELELLGRALLLADVGDASEEAREEQGAHMGVRAAAVRVTGPHEDRHAANGAEGGVEGAQARLARLERLRRERRPRRHQRRPPGGRPAQPRRRLP